jgi:hypothetical protein
MQTQPSAQLSPREISRNFTVIKVSSLSLQSKFKILLRRASDLGAVGITPIANEVTSFTFVVTSKLWKHKYSTLQPSGSPCWWNGPITYILGSDHRSWVRLGGWGGNDGRGCEGRDGEDDSVEIEMHVGFWEWFLLGEWDWDSVVVSWDASEDDDELVSFLREEASDFISFFGPVYLGKLDASGLVRWVACGCLIQLIHSCFILMLRRCFL